MMFYDVLFVMELCDVLVLICSIYNTKRTQSLDFPVS